MSFTSLLATVTATGLHALADFDRDAALAAGLSSTTVNNWKSLHELYYGSSACPKQQRIARELAIEGAFSFDQLLLIERRLRAAGLHRTAKRTWKLRQKLLAAPCTYASLERAVKKLVEVKPAPPQDRISFSKSREGKRTFSVTANERDLADLEHALSENLDLAAPAGPQMLSRFISMLRDGGGFAVPVSVPRPQLLVPLEAHVKVLGDIGDDTLLGLTDGTSIPASQYLSQFFADPSYGLEVALFHPVEGPVNLFRAERHANAKQRALAKANMPVCVVPGCRQPADNCQMHHMKAWKHGGYTNVSNLVPLCRYHNQINDDDANIADTTTATGATAAAPAGAATAPAADDPHFGGRDPSARPSRRAKRKKRNPGDVVPVGAVPMWRSPKGFLVPNDAHPNYRFGAMFTLFPDLVPAPARQGAPPTRYDPELWSNG